MVNSPFLDCNKALEGLKAVIADVPSDDCRDWTCSEALLKSLEMAQKRLETDLKAIEGQSAVFFSDGAGNTADVVDTLRGWHVMGDDPSMVAMVAAACNKFEITQPDLLHSALMAAALGDVESDLPYHNNHHFKKVLLHVIRLIHVHNNIYGDTAKALDEAQCALLIIAACIHDLDHDGLGNTIKGVFYPGRLEKHSVVCAAPYLRATGMQEEWIETLNVMILTTDVAPLGDLTNAVNQMKAAYRFHFMGENEHHETLNLSHNLDPLERDDKTALMACLLHEADIATSAGLTYAVTQFETCMYRQEMGLAEARPMHVTDFLEKVCQRRFLSDAGQKLFSANLARIYALAQDEEKNGNQPFPKAQHTDFILQAGQGDTSKSLN